MDINITDNSDIPHISHTALWVAYYRAMESKRKDALFHDPYAELLAGERGKQIVENTKGWKNGAWPMIVRTAVLDEFIMRIDLGDSDARRKLFGEINHDAERAFVITEGLLIYLGREEVAGLARDLKAQESFRWWTVDIATPVLLGWLLNNSFRQFAEGDIQMKFAPEEGPGFFKQFGCKVAESRLVSKESRRLKREMPGIWFYRLLAPLASKKQRKFYSKLDSYFVLLNNKT